MCLKKRLFPIINKQFSPLKHKKKEKENKRKNSQFANNGKQNLNFKITKKKAIAKHLKIKSTNTIILNRRIWHKSNEFYSF